MFNIKNQTPVGSLPSTGLTDRAKPSYVIRELFFSSSFFNWLLTRPRLHSYIKAIGHRNQVMNHKNIAEDRNRCRQSHVQGYDGQKRIKRQLKSSHTFHQTPCGRARETTVRMQWRQKNLELFDLVTQE
jgi:hypothetical protein